MAPKRSSAAVTAERIDPSSVTSSFYEDVVQFCQIGSRAGIPHLSEKRLARGGHENRDRVVPKEEIFATIWSGVSVSDNALTRAIAQIRKALEDDPRQPRYIETLPTVGYRFIARVASAENSSSAQIAEESPADIPVDISEARHVRWPGYAMGYALVAAALLAVLTWFLYPHSVAITSVAVLPFVNAGQNADAEYLSDGITDTLIGNLSTLAGLKVKSSNASRKYKGPGIDAGKAGRELGVGAVVTGRITLTQGQRGDNLSIEAELVDSRGNSELWGENFERKTSDILTVQQVITDGIARTLRIRLSATEKQRLAGRQTTNPEAYQLYLKGQYFLSKFTKDGADKGLAYTQQAIAADPGYALAYEGVAGYYSVVSDVFMPDRDALPKAQAASRKAIELDDGLAEAHADLASGLFWYDYDWPGAEMEFRRALELNPNLPRAHDNYGWYLTCLGFQARGIEEGSGETGSAQCELLYDPEPGPVPGSPVPRS